MTFRLLFRSVRHEWPRLLSAVLGVAAATGLLAWHLGRACTAIHSGHDAAARAAAPFSAWIGPPAPGPRPDSAKADAKPRPKGRARATAEATGGRRMMGRGGGMPIPRQLTVALESSSLVEKVVPLATIGVTMDVRPGGRVLQGPPFSGRVVELPADGIPFNVGEIEGRLPDSATELPEVVASESLFGARRDPAEACVAQTDGKALFLSKTALEELLQADFAVTQSCLAFLTAQIDALNAAAAAAAGGSAEAKTAGFLLEHKKQGGDEVALPPDFSKLARQIGVSRDALNRALDRLTAAGAIGFRGKSIVIRDPEKLDRFIITENEGSI